MDKKDYTNYLTIVHEFYNPWISRMQEKKIKLHSDIWTVKENNKALYLPPTVYDIFNQKNSIIWIKKQFNKNLWLEIMEPSDEIKEKLKDNIARQNEVMDTIKLRNEKFNYNCWLIKAWTWVWKSVLAIKITKYFDCNTLILVSNLKLLWELINRFEEFTWWKPAQYWWGKKEIDVITICTKSSFSKDYKKICSKENFQTIIIDECHEWFSDNFRLAINESFHEVSLFWMSATPFTPMLEQQHLERYFGAIIDVMDWYDYKPDFEIINYKPWKICIEWIESPDYIFEDYPELRWLMAQDSIRFNYQIKKLWELFQTRKCIIVLTDRTLEADNFTERLWKWDLIKFNLIKITWETKISDDEIQLEEAKKNWKKTIIIWSIKKIWTWFDHPPTDTIFLASAIKWKSTTEQAIWRSLRKFDKLNPLVVIWNDEALKGQKLEKLKTIKKVYWVTKNEIKFFNIWDHRVAHEKMKLDFTDVTQK